MKQRVDVYAKIYPRSSFPRLRISMDVCEDAFHVLYPLHLRLNGRDKFLQNILDERDIVKSLA